MRAGEKKALLIFALVLLMWRVFEVARVEDAFLQFMTVGALPWTNKVLSPDQVLLLVAALFSVSLLLIFRKELVRSFRRRAVAHRQPTVVRAAAKEPVASPPSTSIVVRMRRHKGVRIPMPQLQIRDKKLPELYIPSIMPTVWRVMDWEMKQLASLYRLLGKVYQWVKVHAIKGGKHAWTYGAVFWKWLEPRLREFDKWLEKKARKNRVSSDIIEILDDCWRTVRFYVRKWTS